MADKNFARSGTGDAGLLADDDPLSELARLVNYEPRPVQGVAQPLSDTVQPVTRRENPVLALEDELMRAFEQYDGSVDRPAGRSIAAEKSETRYAEPVFDVPEPAMDDGASVLDEVPARDAFVSENRYVEPSFAEQVTNYHAPVHAEPAFDVQEEDFREPSIEETSVQDFRVQEVQYSEPSFVEPVVAYEAPVYAEPVFEEPVADLGARYVESADVHGHVAMDREPAFDRAPVDSFAVFNSDAQADSALLLADELEGSFYEVSAPAEEPEAHAGLQFADRFEPQFDAPQYHQPLVETGSSSDAYGHQEPAFLGLQPVEGEPVADLGSDLERELELSLGDTFADERHLHDGTAPFVQPLPVAAATFDSDAGAALDHWMPADAGVEHAEPFHAQADYVGEEPHFVSDIPFETQEDRTRAATEAELQWQGEPALEAEPEYQVQSVQKGHDYDRDTLLADIERFPVPSAHSPLTAASVVAATAPRNSFANIAGIFGRATPTTQQRDPAGERTVTPVAQPIAEPVFKAEAAVIETRREPVVVPTPAAAEPELDFANMEFDLSDIDLDLSDLSLDDQPAKVEPVAKAEVARPVEVERPVRREPAVAVPVSTYTAPQPVIAETADGSLPFDPTMIADTDIGVSPVTELDVPQLPVIEKEKPPAYQPDYDFDIDAEMAQLFTEPAAKPRTEEVHAGVSAAAAVVGQPAAQINDVDDFERALEEDFRRSLSQPERMAIPVDPGQANTLYAGDGYDDETSRPRRGLLIAASIAGLLLIGGGGVYAWSSFTGGGTASTGEPRVILADKEPIKVVPEERGGKTVPNQDKAVYDRVAGDTARTPQQEQLVTSTEEPIDVVQRTLTPETLPFDDADDGVDTAAADDDNRLLPGVDEPETATTDAKPVVSPRKVRTMIVKPDGTLVAREDSVAEPEAAEVDAKATATTGRASGEAAATANASIDTQGSLRAEQAAAESRPRSALAEVANAQVDDTAPVRTVKTTTFGAAGNTTAGDNTPLPETRPVDQPVNVVGTVTENGNVRNTQTASATQTTEQTQVAAVAPGSYVIQIASLPSQAEAQKTYNSLSSKFGNVIGGRGVDIKEAVIPNKGTFYRIRIPAGSRDEANALCNRYKSAGGSCLVTR